jgi:phosphomannomutase/phosphoglucomutase
MKEIGALLAGEMSGHLFFADNWYGFDDALYSAARLLQLLSQQSESMQELFSKLPNSINTPEIKIPVAHEHKFSIVKEFAESAEFDNPHRRVLIDGVRIEFKNGWGLLRASNTTPCLVLRFEADDQETLDQIQKLFYAQLNSLL